ncbi:MAG: HlyD family type I secretion periplasmic adaptor subunit [Parvularculaceae bacterium]
MTNATEKKARRPDAGPLSARDARHLASPAALDEPTDLSTLKGVAHAIAGVVLAFLVWASVASGSAVARATGEVAPSGAVRGVQHRDGGAVAALHVEDGELVVAGEPLVTLEGDLDERLRIERDRRRTLRARAERFAAFLDDRKPDFDTIAADDDGFARAQRESFDSMLTAFAEETSVLLQQRQQRRQRLASLREQLAIVARNRAIAQEVHRRRKRLVADGHFPRTEFLATERDLNELVGDEQRLRQDIAQAETALAEYDERVALQRTTARDEAYNELDAVNAELSQNQELIESLEDRLADLSVRSPVRGLVKALSVRSIGGVVGPGQVIAEIVPVDEELLVEIKIAPSDIGGVRPGRAVDVKFSAYDFSQFGSVRGELDYVSATTFFGPDGERHYRGRVRLDRAYVGDDAAANPIIPGMTATADIVLGDRTLLAYLLSPIRRFAGDAFRER